MATEPQRPGLTRSAEELIAEFLGVPDEKTRGRRRPTQGLGDLVESILQKHQIGRDAPEHTIRENWAAVVGGANAHYSHATEIDQGGRLIVSTSHAIVRNELFMHRAVIVEKIRKLTGCGHIRGIHVRAG